MSEIQIIEVASTGQGIATIEVESNGLGIATIDLRQGPTGATGPNIITTATASNLTGFIAANGTNVSGATAGATAATANTLVLRGANAEASFGTASIDKLAFNTLNGAPEALGETTWDQDEETLATYLKGGVIIRNGEDVIYHVENNTASNIAKGTPVMYAGTVGNSGKLRIKPWDGTSTKAFLGIALGSITAAGGAGYVAHFGRIKGIQTNGANYGQTWVTGDVIYAVVGSSNLTNVEPSVGGYVSVAVVIAAHASNGTLFVRPTQVPSVEDIGAAATLHTHGNITSDGRIGSTATLPIITTTGGTLTTGAFGTTAGTFAQGNDSRLSDERVPTAAGIASKITGATAKTTLVDADETVLTDSAASFGLKKVTWLNVWNYIVTKIGAITSITASGAWSFSSTTRPTSSGTGTPAATSLITQGDSTNLFALTYIVSAYRWSQAVGDYNALHTGTGTASTATQVLQLNSFTTAGSVALLRGDANDFRAWHKNSTTRQAPLWDLRTIYHARISTDNLSGADTVARLYLGVASTANTATDLTSSNKAIGFKIIAGEIFVQLADGTNLTTTTTGVTMTAWAIYDLIFDSKGDGTWDAYVNSTKISGTGAPSTAGSGSNAAMILSVTNGTTAATRRFFIHQQTTTQI